LKDPQVAHNDTIVETDCDPVLGTTRYLRQPVRFEDTPASLRRIPPRLGQQTEEILADVGFGEADIAKLREEGAIV
jgi:crotonobetainyl-CoA:carnitine CoA-transferase CaiB-like acyl-CoA transferase